MKDKAHSLKGGAAYSGASRISQDCYYIQLYYETGKYVKMMEHYIDLLKNSAEFRIYWREVYEKQAKVKEKIPDIDEEEIPIPPNYQLVKIDSKNYKVIYPDDYAELAEDAEKRGKTYLPDGEAKYNDDDHISNSNL